MRIGITGAHGFLGTNLQILARYENINTTRLERSADVKDPKSFEGFALDCDWIVHLAGCNRSNVPEDLLDINVLGVYNVAKHCLKHNKKLIVSGSRNRLGMYGASKGVGAKIITQLSREGLQAINLNLPNLFGPFCKPFYNSFVTTMMYSLANNLPYKIDDPRKELRLVHSRDVCHNILTMVKMDYLDVIHNMAWQIGHKKTAEMWHVGEFAISLGDFESILLDKEPKRQIPERHKNMILQTYDWYKKHDNSWHAA